MIEITKEQLDDATHALLVTTSQMVISGEWREFPTLFESLEKSYEELKKVAK